MVTVTGRRRRHYYGLNGICGRWKAADENRSTGASSSSSALVNGLLAVIVVLSAIIVLLLTQPFIVGQEASASDAPFPGSEPSVASSGLDYVTADIETKRNGFGSDACPVCSCAERSLNTEGRHNIHLADVGDASGHGKKPKEKQPIDPVEYWSIMTVIVVLVIIGGMFAGLTIGLMSLDETNLSILLMSGTPTEKLYAERIAPIRKDSHLLLVTLLLANTVVNETLPVLFNYVDLEGYKAVLFSTALIVVFGEIIPQAVCARYGLQVGAFLAWPVRILIWLLYVIARPIASLLDHILGHKGAIVYRRAQLKEFVALHGEDHEGPLTQEEVTILRAVLELRDKTVQDIMTDIKDVVMLPVEAKLDRETINGLLQAGHSRVPVYNQNREDVIGVVLVKQLVLLDPDDATPLADIRIGRLPRILNSTPLFEILHVFEAGGSHMAVVVEEIPLDENEAGSVVTSSPLWTASSPVFMARRFRTLGIVTLEDVIEEMIGQEIVDETDVYVDVGAKVKVARAFHEMERRLARKFSGLTGSGVLSGVPSSQLTVDSLQDDDALHENAPLLPPPGMPLSGSTALKTGYGALSPLMTNTDSGVAVTGIAPSLNADAAKAPSAQLVSAPRMIKGRRKKEVPVPAGVLVDLFNKGVLPSGPTSANAVKIETDMNGIVVDGVTFIPNTIDLDDSGRGSVTSNTSASSHDVEIEVEPGVRYGSFERLD